MYEPFKDRKAWATQQLKAADVDEKTTSTVLALLEVWWLHDSNDEERATTALTAFNDLVHGRALDLRKPDEPVQVWEAVRPGWIGRGDYVRVKLDAYRGPAGEAHNGRRGPVVAVRGGDVIVRYDDGLEPDPGLMGTRHSPFSLEKRTA